MTEIPPAISVINSSNIEDYAFPEHSELLSWLKEDDESKLQKLWNRADRVRQKFVGDKVHLRGIIEISNRCSRFCEYCGIRASNNELKRYAMTLPEIMECVGFLAEIGYRTVVLQSGEDHRMKTPVISNLIEQIKKRFRIIITLSFGERSGSDLAEWKRAGADRYLLKFETSNRRLYESIHSGRHQGWHKRLEVLDILDHLGYEVGSGIMVGIPGQTWEDLANDIEMFRRLNLDMIGIGPYIPHPETPLGRRYSFLTTGGNQPRNDELTTYKVLALTRLLCPLTNIPSTTALHTLDSESGRQLGLQRGANVIMPNFTPAKYRELYDIYPGKTEVSGNFREMNETIRKTVRSMDREIAVDNGVSENFRMKKRTKARTI